MIGESLKALKIQKINLIALSLMVFFFMVGIFYLFFGHEEYSNSAPTKKILALPSDEIKPQDLWMGQIETQSQIIGSQNVLLEQKFKYLEDLILDSKKKATSEELEKQELIKEIGNLKLQLQNVSEKTDQNIALINQRELKQNTNAQEIQILNTANRNSQTTPSAFNFSEDDPFDTIGTNSPPIDERTMLPIRPLLREVVMGGMDYSKEKKTENVNEKIFAGTTVKALLASSVDAVCGVFANSDPVPVKLRLLDDGHLPKGVTEKLKGALLIGSAFGNLSSERVEIRLERLTLVKSNGEGIEMGVAGFVSGEDGKYGVRGIVVDRSGKIIKNAAYSGFLSGTSQILQSAVSKRTVNNNSISTDILKQGGATGASNAFDMLADYYIRRAEQVQPVIQVNAGRVVDVIFTHGVSLGELNVKDDIKAIRLKSRQGQQ